MSYIKLKCVLNYNDQELKKIVWLFLRILTISYLFYIIKHILDKLIKIFIEKRDKKQVYMAFINSSTSQLTFEKNIFIITIKLKFIITS